MSEWNWHKAMTLAERAMLQRGPSIAHPITERARQRLARWKAQPPFESETLFKQRLEQEGLSESDFLQILSDHCHVKQAGQLPAWSIEIQRALEDYSEEEPIFYPDNPEEHPEILFLELVRPLVMRALHRLRGEIRIL